MNQKEIILYGSIVGFVIGGLFIVRTSLAGINSIIEHEGYRAKGYRDQGGKWTIGFGHLIKKSEAHLLTATLTEREARAILRDDLKTAETAVSTLVKFLINQNQHDALVSFAFNLGGGALGGSTLLKKLNAGDVQGAANEFPRWNKIRIDGVLTVDPILVTRRARERERFLA